MKRFMIAALLATLAWTAVAGGRSEQVDLDEYPLEGTITFAHSVEEWHLAYLNPALTAFQEEYPGITVETEELADGGYEALAQRVLLGAAAGDIPDAAQVGFSFVRTLAESGRAVALDEYMAADEEFDEDALIPAMLSLGRLEGTTYLLPLAASTPVMYINEAAFEAAGLDPENPPQSWDEVREASRALTEAGYFGIYYSWEITGNWIFQTMLENSGGSMVDATGSPAFDSPEAIEAMEHVKGLVDDGLMPRVNGAVPLFLGNQLGMLVSSSAGLGVLNSMAPFPFRAVPIPTPDGSSPRLPAGGAGVMVFAEDDAQRRLAWEFAKFLTGYFVSEQVARNTGYLPANAQVVADLEDEFSSDVSRAVILEQAAQVVPWYSWPGGRGPEIATIISDAEEAILLGDADVAQTLRETARRVSDLLGQ